MLPSGHRLPKIEIHALMRRGTHVRNELIELIYIKNDTSFVLQSGTPPAKPRFAFIVSTKIDKRATARNRMRRTMSESVRHLLATVKPIDGIFGVKKNFVDLPQHDVQAHIEDLLKRAGILNTE